jgi:hypothetical protein
VITVGATTRDGERASYSNYGDAVDLSAPGGIAGEQVLTTSNTGLEAPQDATYAGAQGTSVAAAHVTAAAAILALSQCRASHPTNAYDATHRRELHQSLQQPNLRRQQPRDCGTGILSLAQVATASCSPSITSSLSGGQTRFRVLRLYFYRSWHLHLE